MPASITIRSSYLTGYSDCPRKVAAHIIPDEIKVLGYDFPIQPKGIGSIVGNAAHLAAATYMQDKLSHGELTLNKNDGLDVAITEFRKEIVDGAIFDDTTPSKNDGESQLKILNNAFFHTVCPVIIPLFVENRFTAKLSDDWFLSGAPDVVTADSVPDWKFGRIARAHYQQVGGYKLLIDNCLSTDIRKGTVYSIPRTPLKKQFAGVAIKEYDVDACARSAFAVYNHIKRDVELFRETGDPECFLANRSSMLCTPKYCQCYGTAWCELSI